MPHPSTLAAGYRYAEMGYTTAFEPAVLPVNARQAHMEMADTPMLDTGGYAMLGNDDLLLQLMSEGAGQEVINDYVAWTLHADPVHRRSRWSTRAGSAPSSSTPARSTWTSATPTTRSPRATSCAP